MIRLERLSKSYPGQSSAAVEELTLDIPAGRIVVFVGPSGCGKTTTMKLINRLIEPSAGRIVLDGCDVTGVNPDHLRRKIGYTIQQTGLFPHKTVGDNIATVPRMLRWNSRRVAERVDELLDLVGLDPRTYRDRFPKQLSGGQQQRVGVARALGADPGVMLMDEPFGAIDPLNRDALQNEFLRIQAELRKTIVFVTHDIDEAIKMGDLIAIFREGGTVAQYDTPQRILAEPADEFVADFLGSGTAVKRLSLNGLGAVRIPRWPTIDGDADGEHRRNAAERAHTPFLVVVDAEHRPTGWLPVERGHDRDGMISLTSPLTPRHSLFDALDHLLATNSAAAAVVDGDGRYRGVLELDTIRHLINTDTPHTAATDQLQGV